jgi:hypothetical protein
MVPIRRNYVSSFPQPQPYGAGRTSRNGTSPGGLRTVPTGALELVPPPPARGAGALFYMTMLRLYPPAASEDDEGAAPRPPGKKGDASVRMKRSRETNRASVLDAEACLVLDWRGGPVV